MKRYKDCSGRLAQAPPPLDHDIQQAIDAWCCSPRWPVTAGTYRMISYLVNGLRLPLEDGARRFASSVNFPVGCEPTVHVPG
jgi:hypothetical protein